MFRVLHCRRTFIALVAIAALLCLGLINHMDVSTAIAGVAVGLAGANSAEAAFKGRDNGTGSAT